jgi:hypothetical protein
VLCCVVLCCAVLCCVVLCCVVLCCVVLCCVVLRCVASVLLFDPREWSGLTKNKCVSIHALREDYVSGSYDPKWEIADLPGLESTQLKVIMHAIWER